MKVRDEKNGYPVQNRRPFFHLPGITDPVLIARRRSVFDENDVANFLTADEGELFAVG